MLLATIEDITITGKEFTCMGWVFTSDTGRTFILESDEPQTDIRKRSRYKLYVNDKGVIGSYVKTSERWDPINDALRKWKERVLRAHKGLTIYRADYVGFTMFFEARDLESAKAFALEHVPNCETIGEFASTIKSMPNYYNARTKVPHADLSIELLSEGDGRSLTNGHESKRYEGEPQHESAHNESDHNKSEPTTDPDDIAGVIEQIVEYRDNQGLSYHKIAERMGLVAMTVRRRYLKHKQHNAE